MGRKAAADFKFGCQGDKIIFVPVLIGVGEYKVKGPFELFHQIMGVGQARIDIFRKSGCLKIGQCPRIPPFIDFNRNELAAGPAQVFRRYSTALVTSSST